MDPVAAKPKMVEAPLSAAEIVSRAFANSLDSPIGGLVHGTSLVALQLAVEKGALPTGRWDTEGRIYFHGLPSRITLEGRKENLFKSDELALKSVEKYGEIAQAVFDLAAALGIRQISHVVERRLGEIVSDSGVYRSDFERGEYHKPLRDLGVTFGQIDSYFRRGPKSTEGGVILQFSNELLRDYQLKEAEGSDAGFYIVAPQGLPLRYLVGVEPKSESAYEFLDRLSGNKVIGG